MSATSGSPRDRDRTRRYDREDRKSRDGRDGRNSRDSRDPRGTRERSQSPRRDNGHRSDRHDRYERYDEQYSRRNPNNEPGYRGTAPPRDRAELDHRKTAEPSRDDRSPRRAGPTDSHYDRTRDHSLPQRERGHRDGISERYGNGGPNGQGRGHEGSGRGAYDDGYGRGRRDDYERPLDRRAIEEGRRRREEERAMGIRYDEHGRVIPKDGEANAEEQPSSSKHQNDEEEEDSESAAIAAMMGFGGFETSKGKGNGPQADGAAAVHKQRTWRQYMNRRGGFNRPLDYMK